MHCRCNLEFYAEDDITKHWGRICDEGMKHCRIPYMREFISTSRGNIVNSKPNVMNR